MFQQFSSLTQYQVSTPISPLVFFGGLGIFFAGIALMCSGRRRLVVTGVLLMVGVIVTVVVSAVATLLTFVVTGGT